MAKANSILFCCGIYTITSPSGRQYVGSTVNFSARWSRHRSFLRRGKHHSPALQAAWNKYGDLLCFEVIILCDREHLLMYEQAAMDALKPRFNVLPMAGMTLGYRHTEEARAKISALSKGRIKSKESREKVSESLMGHRHSDESRAKMSASRLGKKHSEQTRAKMSAARKGRVFSAESKAKISDATKKQWLTTNIREKMLTVHIGRKVSDETREKISIAKRRSAIDKDQSDLFAIADDAIMVTSADSE